MKSYMDKYIKYKQKYLSLRTQLGGAPLDELQDKITYTNTHCINPGDIFHQHKGECWNDSIQMLLCFSDEIKHSVQNKLFNLSPNEIINMAYLESRSKFLAPIYRRNDGDEEEQQSAVKFEKRLIKYLTLLQSRLCLHITDTSRGTDSDSDRDRDIPQCRHMKLDDDSCPLKETYGKFLVRKTADDITIDDSEELYEIVLKKLSEAQRKEVISKLAEKPLTMEKYTAIFKEYIPKKYKLKKQISEITGIGSAMKGLKLLNIKSKIYKHGATNSIMSAIINVLSFSLLDANNVLTTKIVRISELVSKDIDDSIGMIVGTPKHATSFFICDSHQIYYNDNYGKIKMSWKKLLNEYVKYKNTHTLILYWYPGRYLNIFKENEKDEFIVFDMEANIVGDGDNISQFKNWEQGIVSEFIIIQKENLESKTDDEIYEKLEEQFTLADVFNCSIDHIKNLNMIVDGRPVLEELIYNLKYECNKKNFNKVLSKIDFSIINQDVKDRLLEIVLRRDELDESDYDCVKILIDNGTNFIFRDEFKTPLYLILQKKLLSEIDYKIIELLFEKGQDVNQFNTLEIAIRTKNLDLLKFLIKNKADVNENYIEDSHLLFNLITAVLVAVKNPFYYQAIKLLVESGANLAVKSFVFGRTLLESAKNNKELIELFIKGGINVNERYSTYSNSEYPLIYLVVDNYGEDKKQIANLLINSGANINIKSINGNSLLELIIENKDIDTLKNLIDKGININEPFTNGKYPIVSLLNKWSYDDFKKQVVMLLINSGANINLPDNNLLKLAIDVSDLEIVQLLINKGIDINAVIDGQYSALFYVINNCSFSKKNICLIKILLKLGANVNQVNNDGETPIVSLLDKWSYDDFKKQVAILLINSGANINLPDNNLLKLAIDVSDLEIVQLLINKGIDINAVIDGQYSALFYVINNCLFSKKNICLIKILLNLGANVNQVNNDGETPLLSIISGHSSNEDKIAVIELLLKAGANITAKNKQGDDIFYLVEYYPEIREFLDDYITK